MISERLKELRKQNRMTQSDLGRAINVSQQAIGRWETGDTQPNIGMLSILAELFSCSVDYLIGRTDDPTPPAKRAGDVSDAKKAPTA